MERAVGWFLFLATALLLFGFGYYLYVAAQQKGWFKVKAPFHIYVSSSAGLNVGDNVYLMGFAVGRITRIEPQKPRDSQNVRVDFEIMADYFRYLWTGGSYAKINAGLFTQRQLEVTRGTNGYAFVVTQPVFIKSIAELRHLVADQPGQWQLSQDVFDEQSNIVFHAYEILTDSNLDVMASLKADPLYAYNNREKDAHGIVASWNPLQHHYKIFTPTNDSAWLPTVEPPAVADQLQAMVAQVQSALPGILALTNKLSAVLDNAADATSNLNVVVASAKPMVTNFAAISSDLRGPGALGAWVLGTNAAFQLETALTNANHLVVNVDTNLDQLTGQIGQTLDNLADITSNLNVQVQANSNLLWGISKTVNDTDTFIQGLKHHWLLRSAFKHQAKTEKTQPPTQQK
jgi:ABC-type transporter Mla subunit MlaD